MTKDKKPKPKSRLHVNIMFDSSAGSDGQFIRYIAEQNVCGHATAVRKIVRDARILHEKKQLKSMPLFNK